MGQYLHQVRLVASQARWAAAVGLGLVGCTATPAASPTAQRGEGPATAAVEPLAVEPDHVGPERLEIKADPDIFAQQDSPGHWLIFFSLHLRNPTASRLTLPPDWQVFSNDEVGPLSLTTVGGRDYENSTLEPHEEGDWSVMAQHFEQGAYSGKHPKPRSLRITYQRTTNQGFVKLFESILPVVIPATTGLRFTVSPTASTQVVTTMNPAPKHGSRTRAMATLTVTIENPGREAVMFDPAWIDVEAAGKPLYLEGKRSDVNWIARLQPGQSTGGRMVFASDTTHIPRKLKVTYRPPGGKVSTTTVTTSTSSTQLSPVEDKYLEL